MKKLIGSNFQLNLDDYQITDTVENSWFSDQFTSKITYPFDIDLTDELDIAFGFLSSDNTSPDTLYKVRYFENDRVHDAEFEILEIVGRKVQCSYEYGLEEFPSWNKKLAELPLHNFALEGINIYDYAKAMVNKTYPEVDFCFPAIHTEQFKDDEMWESFEKIINNYKNGQFIENTFDSSDYSSMNKNIMQPVPFALYLIKSGLEGFELEGDVLEDEHLIDNAIFSPVEYFRKRVPPELSAIIMGDAYKEVHPDSYPVNGLDWGIFENFVEITTYGKFRLQGNFSIQVRSVSEPMGIFRSIEFNGVPLGPLPSGSSLNNYFEIDFETLPNTTNTLRFYATSKIDPDYIVMNFDIVLLDEYDQFGNSIPIIENEDKIDLTKAVPDMTFGDFFTAYCNWRNYDYYIDGKKVIMNRIQNKMNFDNVISLEKYEIKEPIRKPQQGISFELKFLDLETNTLGYKYDKVFQNKEGVVISDYKTNKKTNTIEINALPLPLLNRNNIETAHCFEFSTSKIYAVRYSGLISGKNKTLDPVQILLPAVHERNYAKWFDFRINAQPYKWPFRAFEADIIGLNVKSKIYAYKNNHYVKSLVRTQIEPGIYEIEIETESFK